MRVMDGDREQVGPEAPAVAANHAREVERRVEEIIELATTTRWICLRSRQGGARRSGHPG